MIWAREFWEIWIWKFLFFQDMEAVNLPLFNKITLKYTSSSLYHWYEVLAQWHHSRLPPSFAQFETNRVPIFCISWDFKLNTDKYRFSRIPRGHRGSSLGQKWPFYLVLPRSWDLPFCIKLFELSMVNFCGLAETGRS